MNGCGRGLAVVVGGLAFSSPAWAFFTDPVLCLQRLLAPPAMRGSVLPHDPRPLLVVDPDPNVAPLLALGLHEFGYITLPATTLERALALVTERADWKGAFVAENVEAAGDGIVFAQQLHEQWHLPVIMLDDEPSRPPMNDGFQRLGKPLETRAVQRAARYLDDPLVN